MPMSDIRTRALEIAVELTDNPNPTVVEAIAVAVQAQFATSATENAERIAETEGALAEAERELRELDARRQELRQRLNELRSNLREWRGDEEEQERQLRRMLSLARTGKVHRGGGGGGNGSRRGGGFPYRVFVDGRE